MKDRQVRLKSVSHGPERGEPGNEASAEQFIPGKSCLGNTLNHDILYQLSYVLRQPS